MRRDQLDDLAALNQMNMNRLGDPEIAARIAQYEMAYKMQASVPELTDLSDEPQHVLEMYGPQVSEKGRFAYNCLMARRLAERGCRFIQLMHAGWDQHANLDTQLKIQCDDTDAPSAALVRDLEQRGLLDDTLVIWGGEFGRTPFQQTTPQFASRPRPSPLCVLNLDGGRWDEAGMSTTANPMSSVSTSPTNPVEVHDLQATILHQLGIDHERFTHRFQGLDQRLTGVETARVVTEIIH